MDFAVTDEMAALLGTIRRFIASELAPLEREVEETGVLDPEHSSAVFEKSRSLGLYAMSAPEEFGGGGLSALEAVMVEEQFGHTTDILVRRAFGNVYEVLFSADAAQAERWLLPCVRGERTASIAITEPNAGSDAAGITTRAERTATGWRIGGAKHFISDAAFSDFFVVSAVTDAAKKSRGISLFLVDKAMRGVTLGREQPMMGLRGTSHHELFFDGVEVGEESLLGEEGSGYGQILATLGRVRLTQVGARSVGKASHVLELMAQHATQRYQFGQPIGDFQMVQQLIADSVIDVNAARLMVLRAAWELDAGRDARDWIAMVKVHAAEALGRVVDRAVQVFGGMGYCKDLSIERYYRDARVARIYDGASEIHRMVVARDALRAGAALFDSMGSGGWAFEPNSPAARRGER